jgi:hypothetical protein
MNIIEKRSSAYDAVYDSTTALRFLIDPDDVLEGATRWGDISDERLARECYESIEVMHTEGQYSGIEQSLAIDEYLRGIPRAPMRDLAFDTREEALLAGYWPHKMAYQQARAKLQANPGEIPRQDREKARETVNEAIMDKMHPNRSHRSVED